MNKSTILIVLLSTSFFLRAQQSPLIKWSFETNEKILSHPIIDNESIYFGSNDSVFYAIDIHTGEKKWDFKTKSAIQSKAAINNDNIYLKSGNDVFALDKFTGQQKWVSISSD